MESLFSIDRMDFRPCLIIPNYNHGYALSAILESVQPLNLPTIVVNDGSTDDTPHIIERLKARHAWLISAHRETNGGKGAAIRDGLQYARSHGFSHAVCIDGDGQHDTADIPRFIEAARAAPRALILGAPRFGPEAPIARRIGREVSNTLVAIATWSLLVRDTLCGFRVYPLREALSAIDLSRLQPRMGFDVEIIIRLVWAGMPVRNIPTSVSYPRGGVSHFRYGHDNLHIAKLFTRLIIQGAWKGPLRLTRALMRPQVERDEWYRISERGSLRGLRLLLRVLEVTGRPILLAIMVPVVLYMFLCGWVARRSAMEFQSRVIRLTNGAYSLPRVAWRAYRQFWEFGIAIVDKVISWRKPLPLNRFIWRGREEVKARLAKGQGVIFMSAHIGNVEVIRSLGEERNVIINALMYTGNSPRFRAFLEEINKKSFVRVHDLTSLDASLIFELQAALARGEVVALLADRAPKLSAGRSVMVPFLGAPAAFPQGPWVLASLLGAPVYSVFSMRERGGLYRVTFQAIAERVILPRQRREEVIARYAGLFADSLAATILTYPTQWFNFFDFWRPAPTAPARSPSGQNQHPEQGMTPHPEDAYPT